MKEQIVCAACQALVPFLTYSLKASDGTQVDNMVGVDLSGNYVCGDCMDTALKHQPELIRPIPVMQYIAIQQIQTLSGMVIMADDLVLQAILSGEMTGEFLVAANEWRTNYAKFKKMSEKEPDNEH